jgi:uncharacterized Zn-binding protein involved in type VI secretion
MPGVVRLTDSEVGQCSQPCIQPAPTVGRGGVESLSYSPDTFTNSLNTVRKGDLGETKCVCAAKYTNTSGSGDVFVNGKPIVRLGDETTCNTCGIKGVTSSASGDVIAD